MAVADKFNVVSMPPKVGNEEGTSPKKKAKSLPWGAVLIGMGLGAGAYALILRAAERQFRVKQEFSAMAKAINAPIDTAESSAPDTPKVAIFTGRE